MRGKLGELRGRDSAAPGRLGGGPTLRDKWGGSGQLASRALGHQVPRGWPQARLAGYAATGDRKSRLSATTGRRQGMAGTVPRVCPKDTRHRETTARHVVIEHWIPDRMPG